MDTVKLTIHATEEYRERIDKARASEDLRKCRSWIDLMDPLDEAAEVEIDRNCIILSCNTRKGLVRESCTYDGVLAVTEMKDGVLLRLSHKRLLWLPCSRDAQENELLMNAMLLLGERCKYHFRTARLKLKGVSLPKKAAFFFRPKQGYYTGNAFVKGAQIAFICVAIFASANFISQPFQNRKINMHEAITLSAVFDGVQVSYGKSIRYVDLQFRDAEEQTVDDCCLGYGLQEKLESLPSGTQMELLIHPDSESVLQIQVAGETLLDFDRAQEQLWGESLFFAGLGVFMLAVTAYLIYLLISKKF